MIFAEIPEPTTSILMTFVLFLVLIRAEFDSPDEIAITVMGAAVLITVVISGVDYVWSWSRRARSGE